MAPGTRGKRRPRKAPTPESVGGDAFGGSCNLRLLSPMGPDGGDGHQVFCFTAARRLTLSANLLETGRSSGGRWGRPALGVIFVIRRLARMFLGADLLAYLVLALGAALAVGNVAAILRPPQRHETGDLDRAPLARSIVMALLGGLAAAWALASLLVR